MVTCLIINLPTCSCKRRWWNVVLCKWTNENKHLKAEKNQQKNYINTYICKKKVMECKYYINEQMKKRKSLNKKIIKIHAIAKECNGK